MAKKQTGSAKKSAIPYTPEVVPQAQQQAEAPAMQPKASRAAAPKTTAKAAMPAKPVMAEVPRVAQPPKAAVKTTAADPVATANTTVAAPMTITYEMIAERAYYISISGTGGSEHDNWHRAEAELKREANA
jgi:hypothetical protein